MVSACFFHFGLRRVKLLGWEGIRKSGCTSEKRRCSGALSQTAEKQRRRVDKLQPSASLKGVSK